MSKPTFLTVINLPDGTQATVKSFDWSEPDYEVCGFETMTYMPDGESWGVGPERDDETPLMLHNLAVAELAAKFVVGLQSYGDYRGS